MSTPDFRTLVKEIQPRRTGEGINLYLQRIDRGVDLLERAQAKPGTPLHTYLTRHAVFTAPADRSDALRFAARQTLLQRLLPEAA